MNRWRKREIKKIIKSRESFDDDGVFFYSLPKNLKNKKVSSISKAGRAMSNDVLGDMGEGWRKCVR